MKQYLDAVKEIINVGTRKENRTGVDTLSTFNINYEIDLREGFPLLTTKKISWKNIVIENLWFLSGNQDISFLKKHNCKFWDPWADENGKVPSAYGNFWRQFPIHGEDMRVTGLRNDEADYVCREYNDQIRWVVNQLKNNPMSRRLVVSAWAPGNAQTSKLPPCHALWVCNVQNFPRTFKTMAEEIDFEILNDLLVQSGQEPRDPNVEQRLCLHLTQRSCDIALGVPYNIAGYAFINHVLCHLTGLKPGIFAHTLIDAHAYTCKPDGSMAEYDHVPGLVQQLLRDPRPLPKLTISDKIKSLEDIEDLINSDASTEEILDIFKLENYDPHPAIKFKVAV